MATEVAIIYWYKLQKYTYNKKRKVISLSSSCVIRLGLEPRTPSLKGMCSTC